MALAPDRFLAQLDAVSRSYRQCADRSKERLRELWGRLTRQPELVLPLLAMADSAVFMLPRPLSPGSDIALGQQPVRAAGHPYAVAAVDGSQIYPDRHEGVPFFLVRAAAVKFGYAAAGPSSFSTAERVQVHALHDGTGGHESVGLPPALLVDRMRTELELRLGAELAVSGEGDFPVLFDGSLVFWHLSSRQPAGDPFFTSYCESVHTCAQAGVLTAWYTSLPQGRDFVNLVRAAFPGELASGSRLFCDAELLDGWLLPLHRTESLQSGAEIAGCYPPELAPAFFYLHTGGEIGRVELPAWIARQAALCDRVAALLIDQCAKGDGYPLCLAEAHEHVVVRGADRELFFACARDMLEREGGRVPLSRKALLKRRAGF
ncbi:MAG: DNA double-strand break repair nuclease NurA [Candidatus Dependentiae bacterium]|nr:DNA double-strand break repair nuclease NurA [Candidatus Dependentiae bacterium]